MSTTAKTPPTFQNNMNNSNVTTMSKQTTLLLESLPISEMRALHSQALHEAESKRTELRLVLSSRYRDLVGSSDEVLKMESISNELLSVLKTLPEYIKLLNDDIEEGITTTSTRTAATVVDAIEEEDKSEEEELILAVRQKISHLTRMTHRHIDEYNPKQAAKTFIVLLTIIKSQGGEEEEGERYPLAKKLGKECSVPKFEDALLLQAQIRMTYLHMESIPNDISNKSLAVLETQASSSGGGVEKSRGALVALMLLDTQDKNTLCNRLLDMYYNAKAKLITSYVEQLRTVKDYEDQKSTMITIVQLLQYDIFLHSYQLFLSSGSGSSSSSSGDLPKMDGTLVKAKCSQFLSNHIPFIRNRLKQTLISISVNADKLGTIRQTLYDETNSVVSHTHWETALHSLVDLRVLSSILSSNSNLNKAQSTISSFNLWSVFFSSTFSSLVHDILTTSFMNVHSGIIETLHRSLANAPNKILPHEAYRNTHVLVQQLDASLKKLSNDAHSLLIHAEERQESLLRLQQSLYVQTSEIMGRLLSELRRRMMPQEKVMLVIGRFAFLMKFKLSTLSTLLTLDDGASHGGRITLSDLKSAFEIADVDDDGILSLEEAMESMTMALSGTTFNGVQMLRSALLLEEDVVFNKDVNLTILELSLLCARGLKHEDLGDTLSAHSMIQTSLDSIVSTCFQDWAEMVLYENNQCLSNSMSNTSYSSSHNTPTDDNFMVSSPIIEYLLNAATILNNNICPADSLPPHKNHSNINLCHVIRKDIIFYSLSSLLLAFQSLATTMQEQMALPSQPQHDVSWIQLLLDVEFIHYCYFQRNATLAQEYNHEEKNYHQEINKLISSIRTHLTAEEEATFSSSNILQAILPSYNLYLTSLFGEETTNTKKILSLSETAHSNTVNNNTNNKFITPIPSSKRFVLLSVQEVNRQLLELQLVKKDYTGAKKEDGADSATSSTDGKSGWFLNMLKKK